MIYATRETLEYLNRLWNNRPAYPCDIVAVGGGMSWLHHLSEHVETLYVVDANEAQLDYIKTILLQISMLSFNEFKAEQIAWQKSLGYKVHWHEQELQKDTFNWNFGSYYFEEPTYLSLRAIIQHLNIHFVHERIELFDFSIPSLERALHVLVGNADHSQYTGDDAILRRVCATRKRFTRFHSWHRNLELSLGQPHVQVLDKLRKYTKERGVSEIESWSGYAFNARELDAREYHRIKLADMVYHRGWHDTALWHISGSNTPTEQAVEHFVYAVTPDYEQVIILEHSARCDLGDLLARLSKYQETYRFHLEWAGADNRCFILVLERN